MDKKEIKAEILAPCGTYESFIAAVNAGADAVYLGGTMFGARAYAGNFSEDELLHAIEYAHLHDKKVYLTVNTLLRDDEIEKLYDYLLPYYNAGLDAAIVQDFGVFNLIKNEFPLMDIHASTQMTTSSYLGARFLKNMGAARVVTSRELSLREIKKIHENVDVEIETFVHGALCYSYSGQCLMSSFIGARSGNRGRCAQPCRLTYSINEPGTGLYKEKHLLSPKDLCSISSLPDILEAGVYSLKIEGRMKSPEYTAGVVNVYRKYLDMYLEKGKDAYKVSEEDINNLMDIYNRGGFCNGYFYVQNSKEMMTFDRPNHQGLRIGTIKGNGILLSENIGPSDVLELSDTVEIKAERYANKGSIYKLPFIKGYKPVEGAKVFRTRNDSLLNVLRTEYIREEETVPVELSLRLKKNEPSYLCAYSMGQTVEEYGDIICPSQNRPAVFDEIRDRICKLGGTYFSAVKVDIDMDEDVFVPVKALNELRRNAIQKLTGLLSRRRDTDDSFHSLPTEETLSEKVNPKKPLVADTYRSEKKCNISDRTVIQIMTIEQADIVLSPEYVPYIDAIYVSTELMGLPGTMKILSKCQNMNIDCYLCFPFIFRDKAEKIFSENMETIKKAGFKGFVIRNYEELQFVNENNLNDHVIVSDYNLYSFNSSAVRKFNNCGVDVCTISEELNKAQIRDMLRQADGFRCQKIIYGYIPLMVTAGCTYKYTSKEKVCNNPGIYHITDRLNNEMPVINSCNYCYNLIFNPVSLYLADKYSEMTSMGIVSFRIMFTVEDGASTKRALSSLLPQGKINKDISSYKITRGHYNRGLQ